MLCLNMLCLCSVFFSSNGKMDEFYMPILKWHTDLGSDDATLNGNTIILYWCGFKEIHELLCHCQWYEFVYFYKDKEWKSKT